MALLGIQDLSIRFGGVVALDGVTFQHEGGQILGLIGPNGSGKTTVFNCITRVYTPDEGSITFDGIDVLRMAPHEVIAAGVARTFQNLELFNSMTVLENVLVGQHTSLRSNVIESAFALPRARREERDARKRADEMLDFLGLEAHRDVPAGSLAFGVKKRVELARALVSLPRLLLLDEPANGLNFQEVGELSKLVRTLRDDLKLTILLVEHHMGMVMGVSDQVCVLNYGMKIGEGTPEQVQSDPAVIGAYLGEPEPSEEEAAAQPARER
ncbi:MAG: ABC transporter ATP-binding protein [Dehalococcoidia bacterium]|nr:ABC transporter ATP-binding protein [Dehalococcoidia bacterium]